MERHRFNLNFAIGKGLVILGKSFSSMCLPVGSTVFPFVLPISDPLKGKNSPFFYSRTIFQSNSFGILPSTLLPTQPDLTPSENNVL